MEQTEREKYLEELLNEALNLFSGTHELCDEVLSEEWLWKWKTEYALYDETKEESSATQNNF
jgi:hypothetical protein